MRVAAADIRAVQIHYPRIYMACHVDHVRRRANPVGLTAHESTILAHLDPRRPTRPAMLARHLGVTPSTLSAALKRLTTLGFIERERDAADGRAAVLRLTSRGAQAMRASSVLDARRVSALLRRLTPEERAQALHGLALLARAAAAVPRRAQ